MCEDQCDTSDALVNGLPAAEFYDLLTYEVDQSSWVPFRYLSTSTDAKLDDDLKGRFGLFLMPTGHYYAEYSEWRRSGSDSTEMVGDAIILEGDWNIDGTTLVVDGIGSAEGLSYNGANAISLAVNRDLRTAGLTGSTMMLVSTKSTAGLFHLLERYDDGICDEELGEFCAYGEDCGPCECGDGICQSQFSWLENHDSCPLGTVLTSA